MSLQNDFSRASILGRSISEKLMNDDHELEDKAKLFEETVLSSFIFLERDLCLRRGAVRISNKNDPRDVSARVRYESESHRFDITWAIGQYGIGILIWNKACSKIPTVFDKNCIVNFEPFVEYLTIGEDKPIVPQMYTKMSMNRLIKVMDERKELIAKSFVEIMEKLAIKLKTNYCLVCSKDAVCIAEFHKWFDEHK